jgi:hypothetical protein
MDAVAVELQAMQWLGRVGEEAQRSRPSLPAAACRWNSRAGVAVQLRPKGPIFGGSGIRIRRPLWVLR